MCPTPNQPASQPASQTATLQIPRHLLPADGRFGCGPSLVRPQQVQAVAQSSLLGTSHRQAPVRALVQEIQQALSDLYRLPAGYQVVLGNGGATAFWGVATASLVRRRAAHAVFGEFGAKFAAHTQGAPFLDDSLLSEAAPGSLAQVVAAADADVYAWPHNETSTGVCSPVGPVPGADPQALVLIDATSIAGAASVDMTGIDAYYFAPQKAFGADGGLWVALCSPLALARARELHEATGAGRWLPEILDLHLAATNATAHQTVNTPAVATLVMLAEQLRWLQELGGLAAAAARARQRTDLIYTWADQRSFASPFVAEAAWRSPVVATIDLVGVEAGAVLEVLRANGIVDVFAYRKLGRNQLRIGAWPATALGDVEALLASIDWVVAALS